jgi:AcrR family transcriptional regulator
VPRPKTYDDDLRQRLVNRAAKAIAEHGPGGLALRPVAAAEGTSTTAVYSMFGGRAGLIEAVGQTASQGFVTAQRAVPTTDDPYEDLFTLGRAYRAWATQNPALYQVLMSPRDPTLAQNGPMPQSAAAGPLFDVVLRLIAAGTFPDVFPPRIAGTIWASVHGFVILELSGVFDVAGGAGLDALYAAHLESIRRGWRVA